MVLTTLIVDLTPNNNRSAGTNGTPGVCNIVRPLKIGAPKEALLNSLKTKLFRDCRKPRR